MDKDVEILERIEEYSKREFLPIIGSIKGKLLGELVKKYRPKLILEVGTLVGYSAILMARHLDKGRIISIEIDPRIARIAKANIEEARFEDRVEIIVGNSVKILKELIGRFDLVFLDASNEEYLDYLKLAEDKLSKRAVIVADNAKMFKEDMKDYLDYVRSSGKYRSEFHDFGFDGMEISFRK